MIALTLAGALTLRFAAGGLLLVAAAGKGWASLGADASARRLIWLLVLVEVLAAALLLSPISGAVIYAPAALFGAFSAIQTLGRFTRAGRTCGCYGAAMPESTYSYLAGGALAVLAIAIAVTATAPQPIDPLHALALRLGGLGFTTAVVIRLRRPRSPAGGPLLARSRTEAEGGFSP